ncbi:AzlC family ABC transporter permease [Dietzia sp.]|uniref:AzlC family ABC transporter permease n=1 Tax=Dietzia sp. TaxID=1871616 RepID=UPI002FDB5613
MAEGTAAEIRRGFDDALPVGVGIIPLGLAFGVLMVQSGFSWWWAPTFSILIYAGSMEFLAIGLFLGGAPIASLAATGLLVNFRHVFYGLSFPLEKVRNRLARVYSVYALTDETYAIVATKPRDEMSGPRAVTIAATCQAMWVLPGIVGALAGELIPSWLQGFEFALTALFTVLAIDAIRANSAWWPPAVAAACGLVSLPLFDDSMLIAGLAAFVAVLVVAFVIGARRSGGGNTSDMTAEDA